MMYIINPNNCNNIQLPVFYTYPITVSFSRFRNFLNIVLTLKKKDKSSVSMVIQHNGTLVHRSNHLELIYRLKDALMTKIYYFIPKILYYN